MAKSSVSSIDHSFSLTSRHVGEATTNDECSHFYVLSCFQLGRYLVGNSLVRKSRVRYVSTVS